MKGEEKGTLGNINTGNVTATQKSAKRSEDQPRATVEGIFTRTNDTLRNLVSFIKNIKELITVIGGIFYYSTGEKFWGSMFIAMAAAMFFFQGVKKIGNKSTLTAVCASTVTFLVVLTPCLMVFGFYKSTCIPKGKAMVRR